MQSTHTPTHKRCWASIDLAALERNLGQIKAALPKRVQYVAVVKADAYGHGMYQTVARLMQCGADAFAVANVYEAVEIREIGTGWPILVLGPILTEEENFIVHHDLIATVSSFEEVERFNRLGAHHHTQIKLHLKVDTGMGRIGIWHQKAGDLLEAIVQAKNVVLCGIFTHFSSADVDPVYTATQRKRFLNFLRNTDIINRAPGLIIHADNSASLQSLSRNSPFNAVRVGILQFGYNPYPNSVLGKLKVEPILSFHTKVGLIKEVPANTPIGYSNTYITKKSTRLAILTAGYGDGIPTAISNRAKVLIHGKHCPILGRVSMDQTIVNVSNIPNVTINDPVDLIGEQDGQSISLAEFSKWGKCIPWETLCPITKRVPRIYYQAR